MSTEQDKDTFSLKRHRAGDGGHEGLGGSAVLHGSPDKKKCRSNPQTPSFSTLSEYAPPSNPSTDHLVAANPFDDNYNTSSFKPLSTGSLYLSPSQFPGLGGYGPPRAPHLVPGRMVSTYGGSHPQRSQLHPFLQNQAGFSHPPGSTYGHQENPSFRSQPLLGTRNNNTPLPINQLVRPGLGDHLNQAPQHHVGPTPPSEQTGPGSRPEAHPSGDPPHRTNTESSPGCVLQESSFPPSNNTTPKPDPGDVARGRASQSTSPRKAGQASSEGGSRASEGRSRSRGPAACQEGGQTSSADKLNGLILPSEPANPGNPSDPGNKALKRSPQAGRTVEPAPPERSRVGCRGKGGGGGAASTKTGMHPCRSGLSSAEPVYPCGICLNEVKDNQEAILCEALCQKWFHRVCTGMTETAYNLLTAEAWAVWGCDTCMEDKGAPLLRTKEPTEPSLSTDG